MTMYQCPLWKDCTAHTDPDTHVCDHVQPHEWSYADGDECGWLEGECTEVCQPLPVCPGINCPQYTHRCIAYGEPAADCPLASGESRRRARRADDWHGSERSRTE